MAWCGVGEVWAYEDVVFVWAWGCDAGEGERCVEWCWCRCGDRGPCRKQWPKRVFLIYDIRLIVRPRRGGLSISLAQPTCRRQVYLSFCISGSPHYVTLSLAVTFGARIQAESRTSLDSCIYLRQLSQRATFTPPRDPCQSLAALAWRGLGSRVSSLAYPVERGQVRRFWPTWDSSRRESTSHSS